jgi:SNF2 family DNA or RNA helicase
LKEGLLMDFVDGGYRTLITKAKIASLGMNFQHCANVVDFPSHSYEQYYQGVRRCWRFGQKQEVRVDTVLTEGERKIIENRQRKAIQADAMFDNLISEMNRALSVEAIRAPKTKIKVPQWLTSIA